MFWIWRTPRVTPRASPTSSSVCSLSVAKPNRISMIRRSRARERIHDRRHPGTKIRLDCCLGRVLPKVGDRVAKGQILISDHRAVKRNNVGLDIGQELDTLMLHRSMIGNLARPVGGLPSSLDSSARLRATLRSSSWTWTGIRIVLPLFSMARWID